MKIQMIRNRIQSWCLLLVSVLFLAACSVTKHLPEGEKLYMGVDKMEVKNEDESLAGSLALEEVQAALSCPPNNAIMGSNSLKWPLPFGLWIYNAFEKYHDKNGFGHWVLQKLGSTPVLLSSVNAETRVKVATNLLRDYGFFDGSVSYEVVPQKHAKKAKLNYFIDMGNHYYLDSIAYLKFPAKADSLIRATQAKSVLQKGGSFSVLKLEEERQRLNTLFRDNGFYYYRPEFATYRADTLRKPGFVSLQIVPRPNLPEVVKKQFHLGKTSIYLSGYKGEAPKDSMVLPEFTLYYSGKKPNVRPNALRRNLYYKKGDQFKQTRLNYTQEALSRMGIFKYTEFRYEQRDSVKQDTLDVKILAQMDLPYDGELEFNLTSKSSNQTGPGAIFSLTRKNFKRMGANLSLKLKASYEWQTKSSVDGNKSTLNSFDWGAQLSLDFPRLMLPWKDTKLMRSKYPQHTSFKVYFENLRRGGLFDMLSFGGGVTYDFQRNAYWKHSITPFQLTFNTLNSTTARFDSVVQVNPSLLISLEDQFIPAMNYTLIYDNGRFSKKNKLRWEASVTSAGNLTSLAYAAFGEGLRKKDKQLLGNPYAQFMKLTSELRMLFEVGKKQHIATRLMGGVIRSYGNDDWPPYSELFYIGGANSVRAFSARSIGPGRLSGSEQDKYSYLLHVGNVKLEANIEYRFPIWGDLYGATFLDAGNVWLWPAKKGQSDQALTLKNFGKSLALGTGVGLRYDLTFLVIRLDMGIALHAPYDTGRNGYYNIPRFKDGYSVHFAIGYPF